MRVAHRAAAALADAVTQVCTGDPGPSGIPIRYQTTKNSVQAIEQDDHVRQHQRDDRADPGVLLVALGEDHDQREVRHQRRDHVERRVADAVGGEHGLRRDAEPDEQRDEDRREERPLGDRRGMIRSTITVTRMKPISSQTAPMFMCSSTSPSFTAAHLGHVAEVEVGDELRDQQEQEEQARQPGPRLGDRGDHLVAALDRPGTAAVGEPGGEEDERDDHDQAVHERRVADDLARRPGCAAARPGSRSAA